MKVNKRQLVAYVEAQGFNASRESAWPRLDKAAEGGIQHLVSADNGAYYAELWGRDGGSYYAVTGAGIYQMPGLAKGAKLQEALDEFLGKVVGKRQDAVPMSALRKAADAVADKVGEIEVKGRTYLKPGEEPPHGFRAETGPKGGRYYTRRTLSPKTRREKLEEEVAYQRRYGRGKEARRRLADAERELRELGDAGEADAQKGDISSLGEYAHPKKAQERKQRGWTKPSHEAYWEKISRSLEKGEIDARSLVRLALQARIALGEPGGHTACVERMTGKVRDPHAFCAWAEKEGAGMWPGQKESGGHGRSPAR